MKYLSRAAEIRRNQGAARLARRAARVAANRVEQARRRAVGELRRTYDLSGRTDADPRAVRRAGVDEIEHVVATRLEPRRSGRHFELVRHPPAVRYADFGDVLAGDWDRERVPITEYSEWDLVAALFDEQADWEETQLYEDCLDRFRRGRQVWGCASESELLDRVGYLQRLGASIESDGYRRDVEARDAVGTERVSGEHPDEVIVDVGRDGTLLHYSNGRHRLALAHQCDVDEIPVLVRLRHTAWQAVRDRVRSADSPAQLRDRSRRHLGHPDLRDVEPE
ncbi:hypothetical protein [Halobacterium yunchengense]|uniref:hypothetical protein n=1 Tax=Halobacterium yunchengense TaxID=3108497 RepID=UPI00300B0BEF